MMPPLLARPEVVLTHESDLDGLVSGLLLQRLANRLFSMEVELQAYNYQAWKSRPLREDVAWVADFAFEPRMDRLNWLIIDHHATTTPARASHLIHHERKSAALLCYELACAHGLESAALTRLVHLTNLGDIFLEDDPDFVESCDYSSLVKSYGFWNLHKIVAGKLEALLDHPLLEVMSTRRRLEDPIGYRLALGDVTELSPTVGAVRPTVGNTNLIVHQMLNEGATKYLVLSTIYRKGAGNYVVSFRSRGGEALPIAQKFEGGGGHPNAAGATLPRGINSQEDAVDYLRKRLNGTLAVVEHAENARLNEAFSGLKWPG